MAKGNHLTGKIKKEILEALNDTLTGASPIGGFVSLVYNCEVNKKIVKRVRSLAKAHGLTYVDVHLSTGMIGGMRLAGFKVIPQETVEFKSLVSDVKQGKVNVASLSDGDDYSAASSTMTDN